MSEKLLSPENEARLRAAIADAGLTSFADLIIARSMECAALGTTTPDDYSQVGNSRSGGVPDLPEGEEWPRSDDGQLYPFLMQINLAEVPRFVGNLLPERGILYAFAGGDFDDMVVRYSDVDPSQLRHAELSEEEELTIPEYDSLKPYRMEIVTAIDPPYWTSQAYDEITTAIEESGHGKEDAYIDMVRALNRGNTETWAGKLLGQSFHIGYVPDWDRPYLSGSNPANGGILLWTLNSDRKTSVLYGDAGYVLIFANRDAVVARDFSDLMVMLESS